MNDIRPEDFETHNDYIDALFAKMDLDDEPCEECGYDKVLDQEFSNQW